MPISNRTPEQLASLRNKMQPFQRMIAVSDDHVVAIKADGTALGADLRGHRGEFNDPADVGNWKNMIAVSAGAEHSIGLMRNGEARESSEYCEYDCGQDPACCWSDLVDVKAADHYSVGLKADGTLVTYGSKPWNIRCNKVVVVIINNAKVW